MISKILNALEQGFNVMRLNTRMLLVGVLVIVLPLFFLKVSQNFFATSYDNIQTADGYRLGMMHDALVSVLEQDPEADILLDSMIQQFVTTNPDVTTVRILVENNNGYLITNAEDPTLVGTMNPRNLLLTNVGFTKERDFIRNEFLVDGSRYWQAFSRAETPKGYVYIFTEQNFSQIDRVMLQRQQGSYFILTALFIFLMALAYWLHKQTDWQRKHARLAEQIHERDLFSNMIVHEFRSPLTAIKGYASFLEEAEDISKDERRFASNIRQSAEHLVALVSDFLEVARLQSGKMKIEKTQIDLRKTLSLVRDNLQGMAQEKGLELLYKNNKNLITMNTDESRLIQVLTNVVTNAIKYTKEGSVELKAELRAGEVSIRIMDTGMGITAEDQKKLFAPFTRVGGVEDTKITGTGLGMYITKQLVLLLGGTVGVESIKGVGSHIVLTFSAE